MASSCSLHASDALVVRGLNMGTTSHMAGRVHMDTGVLSNLERLTLLYSFYCSLRIIGNDSNNSA